MPFSQEESCQKTPRATVYQLRSTVAASDGRNTARERVINVVQSFIEKSLCLKLPEAVKQHENFEMGNDDRCCEIVSIPERLLWAARFSFPSKDITDWFYDIAMIEENSELLFGMKIEIPAGIDLKAAQKHIPLIDELLEKAGLLQERLVSDKSWHINDPTEIDALLELLTSSRRSLPVIIISAVNWRHWNFTPNPPLFMVNDDYLASCVKGYAHVVRLGFQAAFELSDRVGKSWSVYDGACRTYFPNVDFEHGVPAHHPNNFKDKIRFWVYGDLRGERAFTSFLIDMAHRTASTGRINWKGLYFVPDARILQAELELAYSSHLANAPERELALKHHVVALQMKLKAAEKETGAWLEELEKTNEAMEFYKSENVSLRLQIDALRAHLARQSGKTLDETVPIPDNYDELPDWVRKHLAGRVVLLPRAERAVGKAEYAEVGMVYRALLILANEYRDSRMGIETDEVFRTALAKYNMDFSGSIDKARAGQEGDAYYVNYPIGAASRELLKFHIERGNSRERRYCMRIYFFWDDDARQVVIGWLPGHLSNRAT